MQYRTLGRSDITVSSLALGTDNIANPTPEKESIELIHAALDAGITLIDTANVYADGEAERVIGKAIAGRRADVVVATKAFYPTGPDPLDRGASRPALMKACDESLRRLDTDYIDLYQLHRPDFDIPIEETMGALHELVELGKVRAVGSSTSPAWRVVDGIRASQASGWQGFATEQPPYNILDRRIENETVPMAQAFGLGLLPWSPMAMGILAGRYADTEQRPTDSRARIRGGIYAERVSASAVQAGNAFVHGVRDLGHDAAQMAVCWVKDQPSVVAPLIGPKTVTQLAHLVPVGDLALPTEVADLADRICPAGSAVANFHNSAPWMRMILNPNAAAE